MNKRVLVTGSAGFIGSHLTERLLDLGREVVGFDDLSTGDKANLTRAMHDSKYRFVKGDLCDPETTRRVLEDCELIFHLAADPEVRAGAQDPDSLFRRNLVATYNLLEAARKRGTHARLVFASTSTVYGEASVIPTPEDYGPMLPVSMYGATKLGCEALASSYTQLLPLQVLIFRFANVVGGRARHGVVYDFIMKLRKDATKLEVLGDGTQTKSYLHVDDCVDAFLMALDESLWKSPIEVYNIGSEDRVNVLRIAQIVTAAMGLGNVSIATTHGLGGKAWPGDVKTMQLDIAKMKGLGWRPKRNSEEAVQLATEQLIRPLGIM